MQTPTVHSFFLSAVMQHRMMKQAMNAWNNGQIYAPLSNASSQAYQMNPMLYAGQSTKSSFLCKV